MAKKHPTYYDSQAAASKALGIPVDWIRLCARSGSQAIRHNRVYPTLLKRWIAANKATLEGQSAPGSASPKEQKLQEEVRKLRLANDYKAGLLVRRSDVCEALSRILGRMRSDVERILAHDLPVRLGCPDVPAARIELRSVGDRIFAALEECAVEVKA